MVESRGEYDVVVVGGGTAGAIAGIAAARTGAKTLIVEKDGYLGGALAWGMSLLGSADGEGYWALGGVGRELVDRLVEIGGATEPSLDPMFGSVLGQDPELMKVTLLEMAREAGVDLLFHSIVIDTVVEEHRIKGLMIANKAGTETIPVRAVVDCSADADVVAHAGGEFAFGRAGDQVTQPVSRIFRVGGVDLERVMDYLEDHPEEHTVPESFSGEDYTIEHLRNTPGVTLEGFFSAIKKARQAGDLNISRYRMGMYTLPDRSEVGINITRVHEVDGTDPDDVTRAEVETQFQTLEATRFLRKYVPGFENCHIIAAPPGLGIRETRHIVGEYMLTQEDVLEGQDFEDQVGRAAYPLDIHDVKPDDTVLGSKVGGGGVTLLRVMKSVGVPKRCLIPNGLDNVTVGGRCISASHEAAGSIRGQAPCMVTGHAAGTIATLTALRNGCARDLPATEVQEVLFEQDAVLERRELIESVARTHEA